MNAVKPVWFMHWVNSWRRCVGDMFVTSYCLVVGGLALCVFVVWRFIVIAVGYVGLSI